MERLSKEFRKGSDAYFLDRLLCAGIAEARGCERFGLVAGGLPAGEDREFYREIARAEVRHQDLYLRLAGLYFDALAVEDRLDALLAVEARIVGELPVRAALYCRTGDAPSPVDGRLRPRDFPGPSPSTSPATRSPSRPPRTH